MIKAERSGAFALFPYALRDNKSKAGQAILIFLGCFVSPKIACRRYSRVGRRKAFARFLSVRRFGNAVELCLILQMTASFERSFVFKASAVFFEAAFFSSLCAIGQARDVGACRRVAVRWFRKKLALCFMTFY